MPDVIRLAAVHASQLQIVRMSRAGSQLIDILECAGNLQAYLHHYEALMPVFKCNSVGTDYQLWILKNCKINVFTIFDRGNQRKQLFGGAKLSKPIQNFASCVISRNEDFPQNSQLISDDQLAKFMSTGMADRELWIFGYGSLVGQGNLCDCCQFIASLFLGLEE